MVENMTRNSTRRTNEAKVPTPSKPITTAAELKEQVARAKLVQSAWEVISIDTRIRHIRRIRDFLVENADRIIEVICQENGKVRIDALAGEILPAAMAISYYMKKAAKFLKPRKLASGNILTFNKRSLIERVPFGVVGIIAPWNYPFVIPFSEVITALLAGNAVILKTASVTSGVGRILDECIQSADLPQDLFAHITMPGKMAGDALLESGVDKIFFTGSIASGKYIMSKAAETLTPVVLELGGNDPMIVCEDADLDRAVGGALWAGFSNTGQSCGGVERIYVHQKVYEPFLELLKEKVEKLRVGPYIDPNADIGALTTQEQSAIVKRHIDDALKNGAAIYAQSMCPPAEDGNFLPATVLTEVNHNMLVMKDETFGPVVAVMPVMDYFEAIHLANDSYMGLTASIWTRSRHRARLIASRLKAGAVTVNDHLMSHGLAETPWGGFKQSGIGRTHGEIGFNEMTQAQVIVYDILPFVKKDLWWYPYSAILYDRVMMLLYLLYAKKWKKRIEAFFKVLKIVPRYFKK